MKIDSGLKNNIESEWPEQYSKYFETYTTKIEKIINKKHLLNIFTLDSSHKSPDFYFSISSSLFSGCF